MPKRKGLQAKHIDERAVLMAIRDDNVRDDRVGMLLDDLVRLLDVPGKVVRSKVAALRRRGLVDGCTCGCRGDFRITHVGRVWLEEASKVSLEEVRRDPKGVIARLAVEGRLTVVDEQGEPRAHLSLPRPPLDPS